MLSNAKHLSVFPVLLANPSPKPPAPASRANETDPSASIAAQTPRCYSAFLMAKKLSNPDEIVK
jgi:hypothetical protein